ncbi:glycosyltransferase family 4 protein [Verrucomicrobiota bacterium]
MSTKKIRIFSAIPLPLGSDSWNRDITLIYRGLKKIGVESQCVRLHAKDGVNFPGIIQADLNNMKDPLWWKAFGLDGVVLSSWLRPAYSPIVSAIKSAGAKVLVRTDSNGINSPWVNPYAYFRSNYIRMRNKRNTLLSFIASTMKTFLYAIPSVYDLKMLDHMEMADAISTESEDSLAYFEKLLQFYNRPDLYKKFHLIRHPVIMNATAEPQDYHLEKSRPKKIISVADWRRYGKNKPLLIKTLLRVSEMHPDYKTDIIGHYGDIPKELEQHPRIIIRGNIKYEDIGKYYNQSRILFLPTLQESGPLVLSEALCHGCSCVLPNSATVPSHYVRTNNFGSLSANYSAQAFSAAITKEITAWEKEERSSCEIARKSRKVFDYTCIAEQIVKILSE